MELSAGLPFVCPDTGGHGSVLLYLVRDVSEEQDMVDLPVTTPAWT